MIRELSQFNKLKKNRLLFGIMILLSIIIFASIFFGIYFTSENNQYESLEHRLDHIRLEAEKQYFTRLSGVSNSLSEDIHVKDVLMNVSIPDNDNISIVLNTIKNTFNASLVYVLDANGTVVSSTIYDTNKSLTGNNYAFRPYFTNAINGSDYVYPALGVTTLKRGIYFSSPVYLTDNTAASGVVVVKMGLFELDSILYSIDTTASVISPQGIIFSSNNVSYLYHSIYPLSNETLQKINQSKQFANKIIQSLNFKIENNKAKINEKWNYLISKPFQISGWSIIIQEPVQLFPILSTSQILIFSLFSIIMIILISIIFLLFINIFKRKKAEQSIMESEKRFRTFFESSPDYCYMVSLKGKILDINESALKTLGKNKEDVVGTQLIPSIYPQESHDIAKSLVQKWLKQGYLRNEEIDIISKNGKDRSIIANVDDVKDTNGELLYSILIQTDITELKDAHLALERYSKDLENQVKQRTKKIELRNKELSSMNKALKEAEKQLYDLNVDLEKRVQERTSEVYKLLKQKDEFIAQLGHDLKTPLSPLVSLLPLLKKYSTDDKSKELIEVSLRAVNRIKGLVTKTLSLAFLSSDDINITFENANLTSEVDKVIHDLKSFIDMNHVEIENNVDDNLFVEIDSSRIEELFDNLITNAIKYSGEEKVGKISIDAKELDDFIEVSVQDNGIGLSERQANLIFNEFYKADWARHDIGSHGLGLSISKRIVEHHGGKIWVESEGIGEGSTFYFTLKKGTPPNMK